MPHLSNLQFGILKHTRTPKLSANTCWLLWRLCKTILYSRQGVFHMRFWSCCIHRFHGVAMNVGEDDCNNIPLFLAKRYNKGFDSKFIRNSGSIIDFTADLQLWYWTPSIIFRIGTHIFDIANGNGLPRGDDHRVTQTWVGKWKRRVAHDLESRNKCVASEYGIWWA